jgi:hypothetical protein
MGKGALYTTAVDLEQMTALVDKLDIVGVGYNATTVFLCVSNPSARSSCPALHSAAFYQTTATTTPSNFE